MANKTAISLTTGLEDTEKVMIAYLVALGAAESGRETLMFLTKEAVRLAVEGAARGVACDGCPQIADLAARFQAAGGRYIACSVCVNSKGVDPATLVANADVAGTVQLWEWIGDGATTFSF
ncbi:MAG: DsrE family protein [Dermatophilaceae bacterium]